jgi:hypothetical protein
MDFPSIKGWTTMMKLLSVPARGCVKAFLPTAFAVAMPLTASANYVCQGGYSTQAAAESDLAYLVNETQYCTHDYYTDGYYDANGYTWYEWCCVANVSVLPPPAETLKPEEGQDEQDSEQ